MAEIKKQIIQMIEGLPDDVTVNDVLAELYFMLQVDSGLKELDEGKGLSHEQVEKRMAQWLVK